MVPGHHSIVTSAALESPKIKTQFQTQPVRYADPKRLRRFSTFDKPQADTDLWVGLNVIATLRTVFYPYLSGSADRIHSMLFDESDTLGDGRTRRDIVTASSIETPTPLSRKLDDSVVDEENRRLTGE